MNQQSVPSTGIHICIMDKVVDEEDSMSQLRNDVERYNGVFISNWTLKINQYRHKEDENRKFETKPSVISVISSSSLPGYVLISGERNAIIADQSMTSIFTNNTLAFLNNTYSLRVEGMEYKINDVIIRFGMITVSERIQGVIVIDFEYLPSGSPDAYRILESIWKCVHPKGCIIKTPFFRLIQPKALCTPSFGFNDLAQLYAAIVTSFKMQLIVFCDISLE